jgi:hypothetical protein
MCIPPITPDCNNVVVVGFGQPVTAVSATSLLFLANPEILVGELICLKFAEEGCNVAINYNSSADRAEGVAKKVEHDHGMKAFTVQGVSKSKYY